ncbi:hypothetical protein SAMN06295912_1577 [Sphingomonas laterariae]|uniref:Uncharacterized protein n=1 Tax=Edaphosphingomonas laterariae TaxID=861865 RepID=A0A239KPR1_9SPHN|nr:hypothetical protein [Sphingomonas laterariae]SNT20010.1 hypothetical protein SAMN06295912_1577 [Sphingomonas laterariae]
MLGRWLRRWRWRWRRSHDFVEVVDTAYRHIRELHGTSALAAARRKAKRVDQPIRRIWVGREVVRRLEAEETNEPPGLSRKDGVIPAEVKNPLARPDTGWPGFQYGAKP